MRHLAYTLGMVLGLASAASLAEDAAPVGAAGPAEVEPAVDTSSPSPPAAVARSGTMDVLQLEHTSIIGNRELPKVLYIVPWKKSDLGEVVGRPVNSLLDEVLAPVDRDVFERHVRFYEDVSTRPVKTTQD